MSTCLNEKKTDLPLKVIRNYDLFKRFADSKKAAKTALLKIEKNKKAINRLTGKLKSKKKRDKKRLQDIHKTISRCILLKIRNENIFKSSTEEASELGKTIIIQYIPLVHSIARKFRHVGDFKDLAQEGVIGLMKAVNKFDYSKGNEFTTYATWWIRRYAIEELNRGKVVTKSAKVLELEIRIQEAFSLLNEKGTQSPTYEEIAKETFLSIKEVEEIMSNRSYVVSLQEIVPGTEKLNLEATITDYKYCPYKRVADNDFKEKMFAFVDRLEDYEAKIIRMSFGIGSESTEEMQSFQIAKKLGTSPELIRRTLAKSLIRLKGMIEKKR
jgi:RNA polymerase primary sigma factor